MGAFLSCVKSSHGESEQKGKAEPRSNEVSNSEKEVPRTQLTIPQVLVTPPTRTSTNTVPSPSPPPISPKKSVKSTSTSTGKSSMTSSGTAVQGLCYDAPHHHSGGDHGSGGGTGADSGGDSGGDTGDFFGGL